MYAKVIVLKTELSASYYLDLKTKHNTIQTTTNTSLDLKLQKPIDLNKTLKSKGNKLLTSET